jgi:hypothetical protein
MPDGTIKFHSKHPSSQSMPVRGIHRPSRTGTLLRRHKRRKISRFSGTLCRRYLYKHFLSSEARKSVYSVVIISVLCFVTITKIDEFFTAGRTP